MAKRRELKTGAGFIARHGLDPSQGEYNRQAKLNDETALQIWNLRGTEPATKIGPRFGVSPKTVQGIWQLRSWTHVTFGRGNKAESN